VLVHDGVAIDLIFTVIEDGGEVMVGDVEVEVHQLVE